MSDRSGHNDLRYSIKPTLIRSKLGWQPRYTFEQGLESTLGFLDHLGRYQTVLQRSSQPSP